MKQSAGTLLYRQGEGGLEVLLVHPSGAYNRRAPWSIPKGELGEGEAAEQTARRETLEETGVTAGDLEDLGHIDYTKSRKRVFCFAGPAPEDAEQQRPADVVCLGDRAEIPREERLQPESRRRRVGHRPVQPDDRRRGSFELDRGRLRLLLELRRRVGSWRRTSGRGLGLL